MNLSIKDFKLIKDDKVLLNQISLNINKGELHILCGHNGAGKTILMNSVMTSKASNTFYLNDQDIGLIPTHQRFKAGVFCSFQNPSEIPGFPLGEFITACFMNMYGNTDGITDRIANSLSLLNIDNKILLRDFNVNCSGGEKQLNECLQIAVLQPEYLLADELDSGLDIFYKMRAIDLIKTLKQNNKTILLVTHDMSFALSLPYDRFYIMDHGIIIHEDKYPWLESYLKKYETN